MSGWPLTEAEKEAGVGALLSGYSTIFDDWYLSEETKTEPDISDVDEANKKDQELKNKVNSYRFLESLNLSKNNEKTKKLFLKQLFFINIDHIIKKYSTFERLDEKLVAMAMDVDLNIKNITKTYKLICSKEKDEFRPNYRKLAVIEEDLRSLFNLLETTENTPYEATNYIQKFFHQSLPKDIDLYNLTITSTELFRSMLSCIRFYFLCFHARKANLPQLEVHRDILLHLSQNEKIEKEVSETIYYKFKPTDTPIIGYRARYFKGIWEYFRSTGVASVYLEILDMNTDSSNDQFLRECFEITRQINDMVTYKNYESFKQEVSIYSGLLHAAISRL